MSVAATTDVGVHVKRRGFFQLLFPSVFSGIILGVIGAAVCGIIVSHIVSPPTPDVIDYTNDSTAVAVYAGWTIFFFIGIGAFNGIIKWGFGRKEPTLAEEQDLAGKDQGFWRYFRYRSEHKVVGMQYLATVLFTFLLGSLGAFSIRLEQSQPGALFFTPSTYNTIVGMKKSAPGWDCSRRMENAPR